MATLIAKVTELCNSRCAYCDVVHKPRPAVPTMTLEVLEQIFVRLHEFLAGHPDETIDLIWHGGEPLLAGPDFFARALELQGRHCAGTAARIHHSVQSNLSLFSREFARVFRGLGIDCVGSSYEPIPGVRGPGDAPDSVAYDERFMRGLQVLQEEGLGWGVIYVVTRLALARPLEVFHCLTNLKPDGGLSLNPVLCYGDDDRGLTITPAEFADFLGAIFPTWWRHQDRYRDLEPFRSYLRNAQEGVCSLGCSESGTCAGSHWNVAPDGSVSQCGRSHDWHLLSYGSLFDRSLDEIQQDPQRQQLALRSAILAEGECRGCRLFRICHGGCPLDGWAAHGALEHKTGWCESRRRFVERYFEPITGLRLELGHDRGAGGEHA